ncbi:MAG: response regulator transcription factor [Bacteroides sp.]|nr:response regulator transcription factor [Bacteroides sp.]
MKVLIVEDETTAAENLAYLLRKIVPDMEIAGYTESVERTVEWLNDNHVDLIFMDIHLSDGSAFSIFEETTVNTPIVFTTAYDQYALDAFKVNSIDYLLKPIKKEELQRALDKFRQRTPAELIRYICHLSNLSPQPLYIGRLLIQDKDHIIPVSVDEISCIYSTDRQTKVILKSGDIYSYPQSLEKIISTLDPKKFIRANKQYIIAREAVKDIIVWFDSRLKVILHTETPEPIYISKNRVAEFKVWLISN